LVDGIIEIDGEVGVAVFSFDYADVVNGKRGKVIIGNGSCDSRSGSNGIACACG
jgi:hypothetical protein